MWLMPLSPTLPQEGQMVSLHSPLHPSQGACGMGASLSPGWGWGGGGADAGLFWAHIKHSRSFAMKSVFLNTGELVASISDGQLI